MPMREECKYFESRTYRNGETVRKCDLDLAPEAPWRCPADCKSYTPRMADVDWKHGSLVTPPTPPEPASLSEDPAAVAALLDEAEEIVNRAGREIVDEVNVQQGLPPRFAKGSKRRWWPFSRRG